jgi:FKBP-type peptidyl-prolyl cis-trans isomerase FkpA
MYRLIFFSCAWLLLPAFPVWAADGPRIPVNAVPLEAYSAVGTSLVKDNHLAQLGWTEAQIEAFLDGVRAGFQGGGRPIDAAARELFNQIGQRMQALTEQENRVRFGAEAFARPGYLEQYLKELRRQFKLEESDSGLFYDIKTVGYGVRPGPEDTVVISYKVNQADMATELPQLEANRRKVRMTDLTPGLREGFQMMTVGSAGMLVVPPALSYGEGDWPPGTERGTPLIYMVMLHEVLNQP